MAQQRRSRTLGAAPAGCKMKTKTDASSSGKPKRPATACILFTNEYKKEHPELKKVTEISKAASMEWARLGVAGQAPYFAEYKRLLEVYNQSKNVRVNTCGDAGKVCSRDKPKRPPTAFFLFQQMYRQLHPELTKVVEISKAAAEEWRALDDAGRAPFFAAYDKLMDAFMQNKYPTNNRRISRRAGSAEFLQQSNEVAKDSATNAPGFAYEKDKKVVPSQADNSVDHATVTDSVALREQIVELERKLGQSDSEVADLKQRIDELLVRNEELERKLGQKHESDSEVADLKQRIDELLVQNELMFKESVRQKLDHLAEELLDFDEKNAQHHRILRSLDSANKQVPSSLLATPPDAVNEMKKKGEDSHPAAAARQNSGRKRSLQVTEMRPSKRAAASLMATAASAAHPAAGSRIIRQLQPAASTRKTKGAAHPYFYFTQIVLKQFLK